MQLLHAHFDCMHPYKMSWSLFMNFILTVNTTIDKYCGSVGRHHDYIDNAVMRALPQQS